MAHILSFASGKGGVGKTLLCAATGILLARQGKKVLLIDGDMGMRNMDLVLGLENECFYHILDLAEGKCFPRDVILSVSDHLDFLPAAPSGTWADVIPAAIDTVLEDVERKYDYIFLDCPAGVGAGIRYAAKVSEEILAVVAPSWASFRNASQLIHLVGRKAECRMILNQFAWQDEAKVSLEDMMEEVDPETFAGVVPYSEEADRLAHEGMLPEVGGKGAFLQALACVWQAVSAGKEYPESKWQRFMKLAKEEMKKSKTTPEKKAVLSWNSSSPAYRWRRRR